MGMNNMVKQKKDEAKVLLFYRFLNTFIRIINFPKNKTITCVLEILDKMYVNHRIAISKIKFCINAYRQG